MPTTALPAAPHVYVETDIPEGLTLVEWRRRRQLHVPRRSSRHSLRGLARRAH
jgi:hypothetical protein